MKGLGWPSYRAGNPPEYLMLVPCTICYLATVTCECLCFKLQVWVWEPPKVWVSLSWPGTKNQAVSWKLGHNTKGQKLFKLCTDKCYSFFFFLFFVQQLKTATPAMGVNPWEVSPVQHCVWPTIFTWLFYRSFWTFLGLMALLPKPLLANSKFLPNFTLS